MRRLLLGLAVAMPLAALAQPALPEDAIKAAYLYKFRNYVQFPARNLAAPGMPTVIGIIGASEVADHLEQMPALRDAARKVVTLRRLRLGEPLTGVHIVFVGHDAWSRAAATVAQAQEQSVLVVSETEHALQEGSMINFRLVDDRIRFEISLESAEKSQLKLSSQLLTLALLVVREKRK